jgi:hypothetical protein
VVFVVVGWGLAVLLQVMGVLVGVVVVVLVVVVLVVVVLVVVVLVVVVLVVVASVVVLCWWWWIFLTFRHYKGGRSSAKRTGHLYPQEISLVLTFRG